MAYQARAAIRRAADLRRYLARNRRTNTGYEEDVARVMLGRAYEDQRRSSNVTGSESDESSSNDSDFSFGDSDLDYDFENTTSINVPPHDHASAISLPVRAVSPPSSPSSPLSSVSIMSSPVISVIDPMPAISTRGRPRGTSSVRRGRGRGRRTNTTSRTSRR